MLTHSQVFSDINTNIWLVILEFQQHQIFLQFLQTTFWWIRNLQKRRIENSDVFLQHPCHPIDKMYQLTHIFFLDSTFFTIVSIRHSRPTTNCTTTLIRSVVTLIAYPDQRTRAYIRVTHYTFTIACIKI